jgi:hypothetical protein
MLKSCSPRSARSIGSALLVAGGLALLAGCASEPPSTVVSAPPPAAPTTAVATTGSASAPVAVAYPAAPGTAPGQTIVVTQAPPTAVQEPVTERPSDRHVWIPGYYTYRDNRYVWITGRWELPPRADATWVAPRWERESNGYRFYEGLWEY